MWKIGCALVVIVGCASSAKPATMPTNCTPQDIVWPSRLDHESTPATHREAALALLEKSGVRKAMVAMGEVALQQQIKANPSIAPYEQQLRAFLAKYGSYDALRDKLAALYMSRFTELQLRQLVAFYLTPTGQLAVEAVPKLIEESAKVGADNVQAHRTELMEMLQQAKP